MNRLSIFSFATTAFLVVSLFAAAESTQKKGTGKGAGSENDKKKGPGSQGPSNDRKGLIRRDLNQIRICAQQDAGVWTVVNRDTNEPVLVDANTQYVVDDVVVVDVDDPADGTADEFQEALTASGATGPIYGSARIVNSTGLALRVSLETVADAD